MFGRGRYNYDAFRKEYLVRDFEEHKIAGPEAGDAAPDFELRSIDGERFRLEDFRGEQNVVLTFGSATCPLTAGSIGALDELAEDYGDEVKFLFVYVREAHPGERLPAHESMADKERAAEIFRSAEEVKMPILVDDLRGSVHRKYGKLPNPTFLIDKSGRIAYRQAATRPGALEEAIDELLERQESRGVEHAIVGGGEELSMPSAAMLVHSYRALQRGGRRSVRNFREEFGTAGSATLVASRMMEPIAENIGKTLLGVALTAGVIVGAIFAGRALRQRRLRVREPYRYVEVPRRDRTGTYDEPIGI